MRHSSSSLRSASSLAENHAPLLLIASLCIVAGGKSCVGSNRNEFGHNLFSRPRCQQETGSAVAGGDQRPGIQASHQG
jgi:hypothetical protein